LRSLRHDNWRSPSDLSAAESAMFMAIRKLIRIRIISVERLRLVGNNAGQAITSMRSIFPDRT
jgi:hypothetical protein